jgi:hypothetical protein
LAVKSVELLESTRPVKALLLRGADRNARDSQGRKPVELASEELQDHLLKDLETILKTPKYCECFMIKTPLIPLKKSAKT